jgi:hypothetical protein
MGVAPEAMVGYLEAIIGYDDAVWYPKVKYY